MADDADQANDLQDHYLRQSLMKIQNQKPQPFTGRCLYCGDPVGEARYCDSNCRTDHEKRLRRNR